MKIAPSILACDFANIGYEITKVTNAGGDMVHMDVMDGHFVPNISFGPAVIKSLRGCSNLPFDVHLMISNPIMYIDEFANSGADIITFHVEANSDVMDTIKKIKEHGIKAGLSLNPGTDASAIFPYFKDIDLVLIMTVEPGFGGQKFMKSQMAKVDILYEKIKKENKNILIEIDGGVNLETIKIIKTYPVDICVAGTCVFSTEDAKDTINKLKE